MKIIQAETIKASIISGTANPTFIGKTKRVAGNIRMLISATIPVVMLSFFIIFSLELKPIRIMPIGPSVNSAKATIPCIIG